MRICGVPPPPENDRTAGLRIESLVKVLLRVTDAKYGRLPFFSPLSAIHRIKYYFNKSRYPLDNDLFLPALSTL